MGAKSLVAMGVVPEELTEDNYENWKACMQSYLIGQGLWDVISDVDSKPEKNTGFFAKNEETEAFQTWRKKNAIALHAIQMSCGPDALVTIRETDSAKFAWDHLVELRHHQTQRSPQVERSMHIQGKFSSSNEIHNLSNTGCPLFYGPLGCHLVAL